MDGEFTTALEGLDGGQVKSSQELLPDIHEAERSKKHGRGLPTGWAGCVSACGAPAAGRLRGLGVRARALRDTCTCAGAARYM